MKTHWFPLVRPAIRALFLGGGVALGGGGTLDYHDGFVFLFPYLGPGHYYQPYLRLTPSHPTPDLPRWFYSGRSADLTRLDVSKWPRHGRFEEDTGYCTTRIFRYLKWR